MASKLAMSVMTWSYSTDVEEEQLLADCSFLSNSVNSFLVTLWTLGSVVQIPWDKDRIQTELDRDLNQDDRVTRKIDDIEHVVSRCRRRIRHETSMVQYVPGCWIDPGISIRTSNVGRGSVLSNRISVTTINTLLSISVNTVVTRLENTDVLSTSYASGLNTTSCCCEQEK